MKTQYKYPYKRIKLADGTTRDEHRVVMERALNRTLSRQEHVHHVNEQKRDNRLENLVVMHITDHLRLHGKSRAQTPFSEETKQKIREKNQGVNGSNARLTELQVLEIRELCKNSSLSNGKIGKIYGLHRHTVRDIKSRRRWSHI